MCDLPVAWTRVDDARGTAVGALVPERSGHRMEGGETAVDGGAVYSCRFTVRTDLAWTTRSVHVEVLSSSGVRTLDVTCRAGLWTVDGERRPLLDGCTDVDIAATPLTRTLPVRRLGLRRGEHRDIAAVRISVPELQVTRVLQRYTRLEPAADGRARYEYLTAEHGHRFSVDHEGLVLDGQDLYERVP
ncbi:putative glycolipid-binding domain-containing protein [Nocardiopsis sp. CNT-189]|uniref:putative glycolipid-binding domain-containing protein n=1 Tax=Nocardiopsis oceanisediminis TaxID=2816862 RepID=UPI003B2B72CB